MNQKGFAVSGVLYTILILFLVLLFSTLTSLQGKKNILDQIKKETYLSLNQSAPTYQVQSGWSNRKKVTLTFSGSGPHQYRILSGTAEGTHGTVTSNTWITATSSTVELYFLSNGSLEAKNGVYETGPISVNQVDTTAPTTPTLVAKNTNASGSNYVSGTWVENDVYIKATSTDTESGIAKYRYSYDLVNWQEDIDPKTGVGIWSDDRNDRTCIQAVDQAGNTSECAYIQIAIDKNPPTYTSAEIKNKNATGYDVYLYGVSDASGIAKIQCPTWTELGGQDDLARSWTTNSAVNAQDLGNGTWKFHVSIADHNNEGGLYFTHVYLYDNRGHTKVITFNDIFVTTSDLSAFYRLTEEQATMTGSSLFNQTVVNLYSNYTIEFDAKPSVTTDLYNEGEFVSTSASQNILIQNPHGGKGVEAGLGFLLGTNGCMLVAHRDGYYYSLLTYRAEILSRKRYRIVVENNIPRLYIDGTLVKTGIAPISPVTTLYTPSVIGKGSYGAYHGWANYFYFYNRVHS